MLTIKVSKEFLSVCGSSSLLGLLAKQDGFDPATLTDLRIEFEQSSMGYREAHNGPDVIIIPEFVPMCLAEDLLKLAYHGIKIEIGEYNP